MSEIEVSTFAAKLRICLIFTGRHSLDYELWFLCIFTLIAG